VAEQSLRSSPQLEPSPAMMSLRSRSIMEWWVTFDRGSYPAKYWYVAFTPNACEPSNTATSGRVRVLERVFMSVMTVVVCSCGVEKVGFRFSRWRRVCARLVVSV